MTRAMTTVVSSVQTSVITTSNPIKMKLRPITLALLETVIGIGIFNVVKTIFRPGRAGRELAVPQNSKRAVQPRDKLN